MLFRSLEHGGAPALKVSRQPLVDDEGGEARRRIKDRNGQRGVDLLELVIGLRGGRRRTLVTERWTAIAATGTVIASTAEGRTFSEWRPVAPETAWAAATK